MLKKLYRLREWLTLEEAAGQLSQLLSEPVTVAELYRLALDGELKLSINLLNHAKARLGRVVPYREIPHHEALLPMENVPPGEVVWVPDGQSLDTVGTLTEETPFLLLDEDIVTIQGVWDLSMKGAECIDIEHAFQALTGGPSVNLVTLSGLLLNRPDGQWAQLQDRQAGGEVILPDGERRQVAAFSFPAERLPENAALVMRTSVLAEFHSRLLTPSAAAAENAATLGTRERDTLLKILIGMAVMGYKYTPGTARSGIAVEIESDIAELGLSVSDDTVRKYLKQAEQLVPRSGTS